IISDGSLNTRTAWCEHPCPDGSLGAPNLAEEELRDLMQRAHAGGIRSAIHAIGDRAASAALAAFRATGVSGSIEHTQLLRDEDVHAFTELGVVASVQPAHLLDDRDTAEALWPGRTHRAYRFDDLARAGALLHFGSDAPVAPLDPWLAIRAACTRTADPAPPGTRSRSSTGSLPFGHRSRSHRSRSTPPRISSCSAQTPSPSPRRIYVRSPCSRPSARGRGRLRTSRARRVRTTAGYRCVEQAR